jgi:predicted nucleic acid-binding protein
MTRKLFADSGFFIALMADEDDYKQDSHDIFNHLKEEHLISDLKDLHITNYILMEVLHGLADKQISFNKLMEGYEKLKQCHLYNIKLKHIDEAINIKLFRQRNRRSDRAPIGFVDATSLVIMDEQRINCIISFDSDFDKIPDFYTRIYNNDIIDQRVL